MPIKHWKHCRNSSVIEKEVIRAGGTVREAAGSHKVATVGDSSMTFYKSNNISTGVAVKIFKWLVRVGIVVAILVYFLTRNSCGANNYSFVTQNMDGTLTYICQ